VRINIVTGFFLPVPPVRGGSTEKVWYRLSGRLAAAGHTITFISRQWPGFARRETVGGVTHIRLRGAEHTSSLITNLWRDFVWGARVTRALPAADVTICNTVLLPIWLHRLRPAAGRVVAVLARMPKGHGRFYGNVDLLLSLSSAVSAALENENPRLARRIAPFPYPIDYGAFEKAATNRVITPDGPITIGYVGRLHREKGLSLLLEAATQMADQRDLPPWRIIIRGPASVVFGGSGENYVKELKSQFGTALRDKLEFADPEFDSNVLARRYAELDIFCYPSIADSGETFGVAVAEAMAARCAPVVSDLACFRDLIEPDRTGLVFDHNSRDAAAQLAQKLASLLSNEVRRRDIAIRAQAHVERFDFESVCDGLLKNLEQVTALPAKRLSTK
jgi:glycosyltransferase involved in cell wall biosynthesis